MNVNSLALFNAAKSTVWYDSSEYKYAILLKCRIVATRLRDSAQMPDTDYPRVNPTKVYHP